MSTCQSHRPAGALVAAAVAAPRTGANLEASSRRSFETSAAVAALVQDEWANYRAMRDEAELAGHDDEVPPMPTLGSMADSLAQMPDEIVLLVTDAEADDVRAEVSLLVRQHGSDAPLP